MTTEPSRKAGQLSEESALKQIASRAADADQGGHGLAQEMALLYEAGILDRLCAPGDPVEQSRVLRRIGRASLAVGRLAEGHMNALKLIALYGTSIQQERHAADASHGLIYGVWGADDSPPLTGTEVAGGKLRLHGGKRFTSGLGTVSRVVVTVQTEQGIQMAIAEAGEHARSDAASWQVSGMRATASGSYDFDFAEAESLGLADDYLKEPYFEGGVWRYVALHVGGLEALAEAVRQEVGNTGKKVGEAQLHRLADIAGLALIGRLLVEDAARQAETASVGEIAVAANLVAREQVEQACLKAIAIADRALGTRSFKSGSSVDLVRRDLSFFLRQADLDGKLRKAAETLCRVDGPIGEIWSRGKGN